MQQINQNRLESQMILAQSAESSNEILQNYKRQQKEQNNLYSPALNRRRQDFPDVMQYK